MRRFSAFAAAAAAAIILCSCSGGQSSPPASEPPAPSAASAAFDPAVSSPQMTPRDESAAPSAYSGENGGDVDLTVLSATMVYGEVYNMMVYPEDYIGRTVTMAGSMSVYHDETTDKYYYACIIQDATACCAQGIEFVLDGDLSRPEDYPEAGSDVTVRGVFDTYEEDGATYCRLTHASLL